MEKNGNFSWSRIWQLYQYDAPWLKKQTSIYLIVSISTTICMLLAHGQDWLFPVYGMLSSAITLMYMWSPIIFSKGGDARIVDRLVPASTPEKFIFYMSYIYVVMLFVCFFFPWFGESILYPMIFKVPDIFTELRDIENEVSAIHLWTQYLSHFAGVATCLYFVIGGKGNRILKAYIWPLVVTVGISIMETIFIAKEAFMEGYNNGVNQQPSKTSSEVTQLVADAMNTHQIYSICILLLTILFTIFMLWKCYKAIGSKNI